MNSLSWFLYSVDMLGTLSGFAVAALVITGMFLIIDQVIHRSVHADANPREDFKPWAKMRTLVGIIAVSAILTTAIPTTKTMYLILGSEVGQEVASSETGKKVYDLINKRIDDYLIEPKQP